jgi:hypothetical protein
MSDLFIINPVLLFTINAIYFTYIHIQVSTDWVYESTIFRLLFLMCSTLIVHHYLYMPLFYQCRWKFASIVWYLHKYFSRIFFERVGFFLLKYFIRYYFLFYKIPVIRFFLCLLFSNRVLLHAFLLFLFLFIGFLLNIAVCWIRVYNRSGSIKLQDYIVNYIIYFLFLFVLLHLVFLLFFLLKVFIFFWYFYLIVLSVFVLLFYTALDDSFLYKFFNDLF